MQTLLDSTPALFTILLIELFILFFATRWITTKLYTLFYRFTRNHTFVSSCIAVIFLPGTILHELAHYITATVLFLPVKSMEIFPKIENGYIKLGSVTYIKSDVIRGFIVGIAPIFIGLGAIYSLFAFEFASSNNIVVFIISWYLVIIISSTMFSSSQDMIDAVFAVPLLLIFILILYIFQADAFIISLLNSSSFIIFLKQLVFYLCIPIFIYVTLITVNIIRFKK